MIGGIAVFLGFALLTGGGAVYGFWRMYVSIASGEVWLRTAKAERASEPVVYWFYFACVSVTALMLAIAFGFIVSLFFGK